MSPKILYYCPAISRPSGGVAVLLKQATLLRQAGHDVSVVYTPSDASPAPDGRSAAGLLDTSWLDFPLGDVPLVPLGHGALRLPDGRRIAMLPELPLDAATLFVIPEVFAQLIRDTRNSPAKRLVFAQNWIYTLKHMPAGVSWRDHGIHHVLAGCEAIRQFIDGCMPGLAVGVVHHSINRDVFRPAVQAKEPLVTYQCRNEYMQVKVDIIAKRFYLRNPHLRHYRFERLEGLSRRAFAGRVAASRCVLHTDEICGLPTLPLEAMACHSIPVGWRTYGGSEIMHEDNGFWVGNGDIVGLADALSAVINRIEQGTLDMPRLVAGFERTLLGYTPEQERRSTLAYFAPLLAEFFPQSDA